MDTKCRECNRTSPHARLQILTGHLQSLSKHSTNSGCSPSCCEASVSRVRTKLVSADQAIAEIKDGATITVGHRPPELICSSRASYGTSLHPALMLLYCPRLADSLAVDVQRQFCLRCVSTSSLRATQRAYACCRLECLDQPVMVGFRRDVDLEPLLTCRFVSPVMGKAEDWIS